MRYPALSRARLQSVRLSRAALGRTTLAGMAPDEIHAQKQPEITAKNGMLWPKTVGADRSEVGSVNIMQASPWEDNLLERKTENDLKDLLKTMVAFANSVKPGHTAVILLGERDDGTIQGLSDPDNIQKKVRQTADSIYPPILSRTRVYEKDSKHCVRVEIEYDGETPHFGGAAWVRRGSETILATPDVFQQLIDLRSAKVTKLSEWIGKTVYVHPDVLDGDPFGRSNHPRWGRGVNTPLREVNSFYALFEREFDGPRQAEPLEKLIISWDARNQLPMVIVKL
jgi:hypothetical protein